MLSRLFAVELDGTVWAPRMAIPEAGGVGLVSIRSARGRVGAFNRRDARLVVGRAGRACICDSSWAWLPVTPLVLLEASGFVAEGSFAVLIGASNCSNRKKGSLDTNSQEEKRPTANLDEFFYIFNNTLVFPLGFPLSVALNIAKRRSQGGGHAPTPFVLPLM
jgi:hypothetical protein